MTPAAVRADYRSAMVDVGWTVKLRRNRPPALPVEVDVLARIVGFKPEELVGPIKQGSSKAIILAEDVEGSAFTLPFVAAGLEQVVDGTKVYTVVTADVQTRKMQGVIVAYELVISG